MWPCYLDSNRDLHRCERHAISCRMPLPDLNLVVIWSVCDLRPWSTCNFGFGHHALALSVVLCSTIRPTWMSWYLYTVKSAILFFGHLFALGVVMGMVPPLPLYVIVWPSPVLMTWYIMVSIFIYGPESGHYNAIGTCGIHRLFSTSGVAASYGCLVILSKYFALVLLETMWCRAELSALHWVSRCWNFVLAERDVIGERTWGLRKFCEPEEHCTEHL